VWNKYLREKSSEKQGNQKRNFVIRPGGFPVKSHRKGKIFPEKSLDKSFFPEKWLL